MKIKDKNLNKDFINIIQKSSSILSEKNMNNNNKIDLLNFLQKNIKNNKIS